jgi:hypothetical protein
VGFVKRDVIYLMFAAAFIPTCSATGVNLTAASGTITSPNYPSNYYNNANCQWRIIAQSATGVSFMQCALCNNILKDRRSCKTANIDVWIYYRAQREAVKQPQPEGSSRIWNFSYSCPI